MDIARPSAEFDRATSNELPVVVVAAMQRGAKIEAIKFLRDQRNIGLKEAKDLVESAFPQKSRAEGNHPVVDKPRPVSIVWWIAGVAFAGYTICYFLSYVG